MSLIAHVIGIPIFAAAYGIPVSEFGYLRAVSRVRSPIIFISLCRVHHGGVWRHCAAGTLAIIGGDGSTHRLCPDYVDRFLPLHRNESTWGVED